MVISNYDEEFICGLKKEVDDKIALVSNKDYKNNVYVLGLKSKASHHTDLIEISRILDNLLNCYTCYEDIKIEDVVTLAKNKLNQC